MKDDSPASTRSSSPKLDWMIKRGMVGLCLNTCSGFTSTPSVSWFCHEVAVVWMAFVSVGLVDQVLRLNTTLCMLPCVVKIFLEFVSTPLTEHVWFDTLHSCSSACLMLCLHTYDCSVSVVGLLHVHPVLSVLYMLLHWPLLLCFLSQIPINQSNVMDDIEKWLELDDDVSDCIQFTL